MAEEGAYKIPDNRLGMAVTTLAKTLEQMGVNREAAVLAAQGQRNNIYVSKNPKAPILIRRVGAGFAELYEASFDDPVGALARDLFKAIPPEDKLVATARQEEQIAEFQEDIRRRGHYTL